MSKADRNDWMRRVPGVTWPDVWAWSEDLVRLYGLHTKVEVWPPTGGGRDPWGRVTVTLMASVAGVGFVPRHMVWKNIPAPSKTSVESLVLSMLAQLSKELDTAVWEAEREADREVRLF